jgi:hypothetical protein
MSAPKTDLEKQEKQHKVPLVGMGIAVAFALVLFVGLIIWMSANGNTPENADEQIDGRTGVEVPSDGADIPADATTAPAGN